MPDEPVEPGVERWTPQRRRELTRNALIDAATMVFARRGFEGASLDEIAETAGFTRGAIYKNFGGKEDLFFAVFDRQVDRNLAAFAERFEDDQPLAAESAEEVTKTFQAVLGRDVHTFALHLEFRLYAMRNPEVRERYAEHQRREIELVTAFIEQQSRATGVAVKLPAATIAAIMDAATEGFLARMYLGIDDGELYQSFLELVMPVLTARPGH